jgi:hypothetical protein
MNFQNSNLFISYKNITAKTPQQLEKTMLQIQIAAKKPVVFTPPTYVKGSWSTWYLHDYSKDISAQDKLKMGNK